MEFFQHSLAFVFSFLLFVYMIVKKTKNSKSNLPPSPIKLPLIGNLHQLIGSLPHRSLGQLAKIHGPIMHLQLGEVPALIISSPEAAKEVMKTHDLIFADRPEILAVKITAYDCTNIVFSPYGDYWRQLRKICTMELLSSKRVRSYKSLREEEVNNLIASISLSLGAPINFSEKIFSFTNNITSRASFSKTCDDQDEFIPAIKEAIKLAGGFDLPDIFPSYKFLHRFSKAKPALEKLHVKIDDILNNIIDDHKAKRRSGVIGSKEFDDEDLVDVLLKLQEGSDLEFPITMDNVKAVILDIFTAGTDTSSTAIEWTMSELIRHPQIMVKAQAEVRSILKGKNDIDEADVENMNYLKLVIKETLRLHPPLPLLVPREARQNCKIGNYDIPIKTRVIVNAWAIGRDPEYWTNPECFEPERFISSEIDFKGKKFEYIPFGAGRRICPGISFGIANLELPLAQLLYHFDWKLPEGTKPEELDMTEVFGATVRRSNALYLIGIPYVA